MAAAARALRVLIVDDDIDTVDSTAMLLRLGGHEVVTASSGLSALTLAAVFRPELVLLDIAMPGQDGYATAQRIQQLSVPRRPYIVAVTGWATQNHKRRSARAGFDLHLTKPVDGETHQTLAALVLTSNSVEERYRVFSAQQRAIATELILQQLEMANTYLETAVDTIDDSVKVSLTAHASRAHERISTWLVSEACSEEQAGVVLDALRRLKDRIPRKS